MSGPFLEPERNPEPLKKLTTYRIWVIGLFAAWLMFFLIERCKDAMGYGLDYFISKSLAMTTTPENIVFLLLVVALFIYQPFKPK